jgi:hypothetical protein
MKSDVRVTTAFKRPLSLPGASVLPCSNVGFGAEGVIVTVRLRPGDATQLIGRVDRDGTEAGEPLRPPLSGDGDSAAGGRSAVIAAAQMHGGCRIKPGSVRSG